MTTATTNTVIAQTTDAEFRTWVAEFIAQLLAVGLTQTSDTGQINTTTVNRAAINTDAGYAVFRFNDTLQGTAPVFIKFFFGSGSAQTVPRLRVQVGTASNGSGTVSGLGSANTDTLTNNAALVSTVTPYASYWCYNATYGALTFNWKLGAQGTGLPRATAVISRSTDSTGATTGDVLITYYYVGGGNWSIGRSVSYLTSTIYTSGGNADFLLIHYSVTSSLVSGTPQVYKTYYISPRVRPLLHLTACLDVEISRGTTYTATVVGTTSHTYLNATLIQASGYGAGIFWE